MAQRPTYTYPEKTFALSATVVKVLRRLMDGKAVKDIATCLFFSEATVRFHIRNLLHNAHSRSQAEMVAAVLNTVSVRVE
ncbi:LuxR C-terminal-related transcriptional regulator [Marinobacterium rhizophilum]|uniref:LuxR C-terminal-related transcriptional regulator n=1 Tax=Marinobacterium rhizophilum TaxID=420402 RepID=UPI003B84B1AC